MTSNVVEPLSLNRHVGTSGLVTFVDNMRHVVACRTTTNLHTTVPDCIVPCLTNYEFRISPALRVYGKCLSNRLEIKIPNKNEHYCLRVD